MGFFSYAYIVEGSRQSRGVQFKVTAYSTSGPTLFSWGRGSRSEGMNALANDTLYCAERLQPLPGYPRIDTRSDSESQDSSNYLFEESFLPLRREEPVLFHLALPKRFFIRRDRKPFTLTRDASITIVDERLVITLPALGGADLRFWIAPLKANEKFEDYEIEKFLTPLEEHSPRITFELNFGIAKIRIGG